MLMDLFCYSILLHYMSHAMCAKSNDRFKMEDIFSPSLHDSNINHIEQLFQENKNNQDQTSSSWDNYIGRSAPPGGGGTLILEGCRELPPYSPLFLAPVDPVDSLFLYVKLVCLYHAYSFR